MTEEKPFVLSSREAAYRSMNALRYAPFDELRALLRANGRGV